MSETKVRSGSKSVIWRIVGIIILAIVTYVYTRNWIQTGMVTVIHHVVFLLVFYFHERAWLRWCFWKNMWTRSLCKMFTYETICGNVILGLITYMVTGDAKKMTVITLTYIGIKHVIYIWNEFIWRKVIWGKQ